MEDKGKAIGLVEDAIVNVGGISLPCVDDVNYDEQSMLKQIQEIGLRRMLDKLSKENSMYNINMAVSLASDLLSKYGGTKQHTSMLDRIKANTLTINMVSEKRG